MPYSGKTHARIPANTPEMHTYPLQNCRSQVCPGKTGYIYGLA